MAEDLEFYRRRLLETKARIDAALRIELPGAELSARHSYLGALSAAMAGTQESLLAAIDEVLRQARPDTATGQHLVAHGSWRGILPQPATPAEGKIVATGIPGAVIPALTQFRGPTATYITDLGAVIGPGGDVEVDVRAVEAGSAGNLIGGAAVSLDLTLAQVSRNAVVAAGGLAGGSDAEPEEDYRQRVRRATAYKCTGGNRTDWIGWVQDGYSAADRVWIMDPSTGDPPPPFGSHSSFVRIFFTVDPDDAHPNGIPLAQDVDAVTDLLWSRTGPRPLTAYPVVLAPTAVAVDIQIGSLLGPPEAYDVAPTTPPPAVRDNIEANLRALFWEIAHPLGCAIVREQIITAIGDAAGEFSHKLLAPAGDLIFGVGQLPVLGSVSYA